jgi:hypothetical protein
MKRAMTTVVCSLVAMAIWLPGAEAHQAGHVEVSRYSGPAWEFWFDSGVQEYGLGHPAGSIGGFGCWSPSGSDPCLIATSQPGELNAHIEIRDASNKPVTGEVWVTYGGLTSAWTGFCGSMDVPIDMPGEDIHVTPAIGVDAQGCNVPTSGRVVAKFE